MSKKKNVAQNTNAGITRDSNISFISKSGRIFD